MIIFLAGGGTGGPTAPLLAVAEELNKRHPKVRLYFVGSNQGPETLLLRSEQIAIEHLRIPAGKWRRYFSLLNFVDLFKIGLGFIFSLYLIRKHKPDIVFGAGSYVQVPVAWAAFFLKVPVVVHQQDMEVLLSTRLVAPVARRITVAFKASARNFPQTSGLFRGEKQDKVIWVGNPVRQSLLRGSKKTALGIFNLNEKYPTVLVMGGGQGSAAINAVLTKALPALVRYVQVIHLTGNNQTAPEFRNEHYHPYPFLAGEMKHAYAAADLVISRAGMSSIGEISVLGKASLLIPIPDSAQERNAALLSYFKAAAAVSEKELTSELLVKIIRKVLWNNELQKTMHANIKRLLPHDADRKLVKVLLNQAKRNV